MVPENRLIKKVLAKFLLILSTTFIVLIPFRGMSGEKLEITKTDLFSGKNIKSTDVSFYGVSIGDPISKAIKNIPSFKANNKTQRQLIFENAYINYDEKAKVTLIAIGVKYAQKIKGKTAELFNNSIFKNSEKRYEILNPDKEVILVKNIKLDKINIESYWFKYPSKGFNLVARKDNDGNFVFQYFVITRPE